MDSSRPFHGAPLILPVPRPSLVRPDLRLAVPRRESSRSARRGGCGTPPVRNASGSGPGETLSGREFSWSLPQRSRFVRASSRLADRLYRRCSPQVCSEAVLLARKSSMNRSGAPRGAPHRVLRLSGPVVLGNADKAPAAARPTPLSIVGCVEIAHDSSPRLPSTCGASRRGSRCDRAILTQRGVNALAESALGLYMAEVIHRRGPWRDLDHVDHATLESARHDGPEARFRRRTAWVIRSDS
jgi:hypothetical protein